MPAKKKIVSNTDILNTKVSQLQEDVVGIRSDLKTMDTKINAKLDKLLEVVTKNQGNLNQRVNHLEHHTTHPPTATLA